MGSNVTKNAISNFAYHIALIIVPLISTPYVSRVLGADNIGRYSYAVAFASYFTFISAYGSTSFGRREIAYRRDNQKNTSEAFWSIEGFRIIFTVASLIAYFLIIYLTNKGIDLIQIIVSINIINTIFDITWFYEGEERFKDIILKNTAVRIISVALIFLCVKQINDLTTYTMIMVGSVLVGSLSLWFNIPKLVDRPNVIEPFFGFKHMTLLYLPTIATQVYTVLDKTMIGLITNSAYQNGCYEQSETIVRQIITIITSVAVVILPRVAYLYKNNGIEKAKTYLYKAYHYVWIASLPIVFGIICISDLFIPLYLGSGFDLSIVLFQIFSFLALFVSLAYITGMSYLIPTGQENIYTISVVIAAIINLVLNLILIPSFGAVGAAIASITAEGSGALIQIGYCVIKKQLEFKQIFNGFPKCFISSLIMAVTVCFIKRMIPWGIVNLIVLVVVGVFIYLTMLIALKDSFVISTIKKVKRHYIRDGG